MKLNWGTGILITIILFILAVLAFYFYSLNLGINLVEENYYEHELAYQEKIDKINNTGAIPGKISLELSGLQLRIAFPEYFRGKEVKGTVLFYRPSDPAKDFTVPLNLNDSAVQVIDTRELLPGRYIVKFDWKSSGVEYYYEEAVFNRN